jgi:cell wall-associated NlpC family hydrolase
MPQQHFVVNVSVMNLYGEPTFEAPVVTQALLGETCQLLEMANGWVQIRQWDDYVGWAPRTQGVLINAPYQANFTFHGFYAPIYTSSNEEKIIRDLVYGCQVEATPISQGGYTLVLPDGCQGWADGPFSNTVAQADRETIITVARTFLGVPYLWGGKSPRGFDCSGFTQTVFRTVGVTLPRDAHKQAEFFQNEKIDYTVAQPGDLLFFGTKDNITHVAIYLGQEQFIHSQGWVREQSFNSQNADYHGRLKEKYLFTCSIDKVLET